MSKTLDRLHADAKTKKREALQGLLDNCTETQRAVFDQFYGPVKAISNKKLDPAIQLCERTVNKNIEEVRKND